MALFDQVDYSKEGQYHISRSSDNGKTGSMVVTSSPRQTCPSDCPFWDNGCYGQNYGINFTWNKISIGEHKNGLTWDEYIQGLRDLPAESRVRGNQVGDQPGLSKLIDRERAIQLAKAMKFKRKRAFTYTHKELSEENIATLQEMNRIGYTVNVSCETEAKALKALENGLPAVLVGPEDAPQHGRLSNGHPTLVCPQQIWKEKGKKLTCQDCMLCENNSPKRPVIIFRGHGNQKKKLLKVLQVLNGA